MEKKFINLLKNNKPICFNCEEYQYDFLKINKDINFSSLDFEPDSSLNKFNTIVGKVENIRLLDELFWKHKNFTNIIIINSSKSTEIIEPNNKYQNTKLWDMIAYRAKDDIECGGWYDSYNHQKFSKNEMSEFSDNVEKKLSPYINRNTTILEIGCSSGLTMYQIADKVGKYIGTDFSQQMINRNLTKIKEKNINNIELFCVEANKIDSLNLKNVDIVIMNSVIQLFNGYHYFYNVLNKVSRLLHNKSIVFIGDVMDLEKKDDLISSILLYKNANINSSTKTDFSNDLFFSKDFFEDIEFDFPYIILDISDKIHSYKNELTEYRYDVILQYNKNTFQKNITRVKNQYFFDIAKPTIGSVSVD